MKWLNPWLSSLLVCCGPGMVCAQLQFLPDKDPQRVFAGAARPVSVVWRNAGNTTAQAEIRTRLFQTSSATTVFLADKLWKRLEVLPGQTVLESASVDFPSVNSETRFLIQWLEGTNRVLGKTEVLVYPTNLLGELKSLAGGGTLGVLDPENELKPLLKQNQAAFVDLGETALGDFHCGLAIVGPFPSRFEMPDGLALTLQKIARKGVAVVWFQPPPQRGDALKPSFYVANEGKGTLVVVQPDLIGHLAENPESQLNLVYFCKLALTPPAAPDFLPPP
jgi:hypothetical protein